MALKGRSFIRALFTGKHEDMMAKVSERKKTKGIGKE